MPPLRFYVYVSDAKVDMLLAQIPQGLMKRFAAELTIDLKLLRLSVSSREAPDTRFDRAAIVSSFLSEQENVGPVDSGKMYIEAEEMPMRWGLVGKDPVESIVFFAGEIRDFRVFLTGSPHHVIGVRPMAPVGYHTQPGSYNPPLNAYYDVFEDWDEPESLSAGQYDYAAQFHAQMGRGTFGIPARPLEKLSFVARRIHSAPDLNRRQAVIGSPIWVAVSGPADP
jgi:hypothetical protein